MWRAPNKVGTLSIFRASGVVVVQPMCNMSIKLIINASVSAQMLGLAFDLLESAYQLVELLIRVHALLLV